VADVVLVARGQDEQVAGAQVQLVALAVVGVRVRVGGRARAALQVGVLARALVERLAAAEQVYARPGRTGLVAVVVLEVQLGHGGVQVAGGTAGAARRRATAAWRGHRHARECTLARSKEAKTLYLCTHVCGGGR